MTIASEITRIKDNIANTYIALGEKGATLPELQNSDNLANTVGSVSSGGGSRNKLFNEVDRIINSIDISRITDDDWSSLTDAGWIVVSSANKGLMFSNNKSGVWGFVFNEGAPNTIYVKADCVKAPSDATVEIVKESPSKCESVFKITFGSSGDRYVVFNKDNAYRYNDCTSIVADSFDNYLMSFVLYFNITITDATYSSETPLTNSLLSSYSFLNKLPYGESPVLEDFTIKNLMFTGSLSTSSASYVPVCFFRKACAEKFFEYCSDLIYGESIVPSALTKSIFDSYDVYPHLANCYKCGLVFDCSSLSVSNLYIGANSYKNNTYRNNSMPYELFLILPDANVFWRSYSFDVKPVSLKSLQFMADNAPTVSSKTLTIGAQNIVRAGGENGEIITKLKNKGWTVC